MNQIQNSDIQINENNASEWFNKAMILLSEEKYSDALSCYDKALSQVGDDLEMKIKNHEWKG